MPLQRIQPPPEPSSNPYSGVISKFIDNVSKGKPPIIFGDGTAARDFVSIRGFVEMVMLMLEKDEAVGKVFDCGTGKPTRTEELAQVIIGQYGNDRIMTEFRPERPGDIKDSYADISRAKKVPGY